MLSKLINKYFKRRQLASDDAAPSTPIQDLALSIPEIILAIINVMPLADIAALALANKFLYTVIELPNLNLPENVQERVSFLSRFPDFDSNPAKVLCMVCGRYHTWKDHLYASSYDPDWSPGFSLCGRTDPGRDIKVSSAVTIPATAIQLQKRRLDHLTLSNEFRVNKYGLSHHGARNIFSSRHFKHSISVVEMWRRGIMLRIITKLMVSDLTNIAAFRNGRLPREINNMLCIYNNAALASDITIDCEHAMIHLARHAHRPEACCRLDRSTSRDIPLPCEYELSELLDEQGHGGGFELRTTAWDARRCPSCRMLVRVELFHSASQVGSARSDSHVLQIVRYHDLGHMGAHSMLPQDFARRFPETMLRTGYEVSPCGRWVYTGTESDAELCESMRLGRPNPTLIQSLKRYREGRRSRVKLEDDS